MIYSNYLFLFISWFIVICPIILLTPTKPIYPLCILGTIISLYTCYVEAKLIYFGETTASCDINNKYVCSKVITSEYSKLFFNIPNCVFGCIIYPIILFLSIYNDYYIYFINIIWIMSLVLSYLLLFILKHSCVLCTGIHVINFLLVLYYNPLILIISILLFLMITIDKPIEEIKDLFYKNLELTYKEMYNMYLKKISDSIKNIKNFIVKPWKSD